MDSKMPAPEVLQPKSETVSETKPSPANNKPSDVKPPKRSKHLTYRPSHKATFIGLAVILVVLAVNIGIVSVLMRRQSSDNENANRQTVTLSSDQLDKLGVSRNPIGTSGTKLTIGPDSEFQGSVTIAKDLNITGGLQLNGSLSVAQASLGSIEADSTAVNSLNVNTDATISNLSLRNNLAVAGDTQLQGSVTIGKLLTVNNNVNVVGSLSVGGTLSVGNFQANSLTSTVSLTLGGHIITRGDSPSFAKGSMSCTFTASASGNDIAGTVFFAVGSGSTCSGQIGRVSFRNAYGNVPHVVVSPSGGPLNLYTTRDSNGFNLYVSGAPYGTYQIDYIVMQ